MPRTTTLVRASTVAPRLGERGATAPSRAAGEDATGRTLYGRFAVFNQWAEIDSLFEGHFMERFAPGAFSTTIAEDRGRMRVLFQHGRDPQIGNKVLGPIATLREDGIGAYYEVPLLDTAYVAELVPGLEAGLYGSSFRFRMMREEFIERPGLSRYNPQGLPERTVLEAQVPEFGPVTFPAYMGATSGVRSLTDWWLEGERVAA
jgi:HK97 family phage prohead protease